MVLGSATVAGNSSVVTGFGQQISPSTASAPVLPATPAVSAKTSAETQRAETQSEDTQRESVRVSSSIGRAASSGQLSRQEAVDIYRQIASLL